jgi:hypothetical protein
MAEKFPFFLQIETIETVTPNPVTRSLFLETLVGTAGGLRTLDISLSRQAAESLHRQIGSWLADTAGGEPPKQ